MLLHTVTECQPVWLEQVKASYTDNEHATKWIQRLQNGPDPKGRFFWQDGLLYFRKRIWLGGSLDMQQKILAAFHTSTVGGHSGFPATYARIRRFSHGPR